MAENDSVDRYAKTMEWFIQRVGFDRSVILMLMLAMFYVLAYQQPKNDEVGRRQYADAVASVSARHDDAMKTLEDHEDKEMPAVISKTVNDTIVTLKGEGIVFLMPGKASPLARAKEESLSAQASYWKRQAEHYKRETVELEKDAPKNAGVALVPYGVSAPAAPAHQNQLHNDRLPATENLPGNETGMGRPQEAGVAPQLSAPSIGAGALPSIGSLP